MIQAQELRIGNAVFDDEGRLSIVESIFGSTFKVFCHQDNKEVLVELNLSDLHPIQLSPEILEKCGFYQLPHFTVGNNWMKEIGRDRFITVACVGTPNEMVFISEEEKPKVKNLLVARNFDYDGKTYLHQLQNLVWALCGEELEFKP